MHVLIVILSSLTAVSSLTRTVTHSINPGCAPSLCNNSDYDHVVNFVHLEGVGPKDSIHALWSTVGAPSALIARTQVGANLTVDWNALLGVVEENGVDDDGAGRQPATDDGGAGRQPATDDGGAGRQPATDSDVISFSPAPSVTFGLIFRRLVEYDDKYDVADPDHYLDKNNTWTTKRKVFPLERLLWQPVKINDNDTFVFQTSPEDPDFGESLRFEVRMSGKMSRGDCLPRLQLTPNNTHLDLFLDNKTSLFEQSRFYLVADVVNDEYPLKLTHESTIDDEYTPGVFTTFRFGAVDTIDENSAKYAAWKPVAYTTSERSLEMETRVKAFDAGEVDAAIDDVKSVVGKYFGRIGKFSKSYSRQVKIGFGQQEDKFYKKTSFSVWSVLVGIGTPPEDGISTLVIVVISVGLGVPAVFVILGGIYAGLKERQERLGESPRKKSGVRAPLIEEEGPPETYGAIGT